MLFSYPAVQPACGTALESQRLRVPLELTVPPCRRLPLPQAEEAETSQAEPAREVGQRAELDRHLLS